MAKKITIFILSIMLMAVVFMLIDDYLSPQSKALLEKNNPQLQSNAYFLLMGILAAPEDDPIAVGKALYNSLKASEHQYLNENQPSNFIAYPENKKLPLPKGDMFCSYREEGCRQKTFAAAAQYTGEEHRLLRERYISFLRMNDFQTLNEPVLDGPTPPYEYITAAFRSMLLENIHQAENGNRQQAVNQLINHITELRRAMEKTDTLIGKIIFATQVADTIDTIFILCQNQGCSQPITIAPLTTSEMSMELPLKMEFHLTYNTLRNLDKNKYFFSNETEIPKILRPFTKLVFKVNMTTNMHAAEFTEVINTSKLKPAEFAVAIVNTTADNKNDKPASSPRNIVGAILANIARPNYGIYSARLQDLNIKIALFNAMIGNNDISSLTIFNPYYDKFQKPDFTNGMLCLQGPLVDTRNMRCVPVNDPDSRSQ